MDRVERQIPRLGPAVLAWRSVDRVRIGHTTVGQQRSLRAERTQAVREHQLRHRARRLYARGSRQLQREAQRGQRREQPGRREPQSELELRRRRTDRRSPHPRASRSAAAQLDGDAAALGRRADDQRRRRVRPHAGGQQQRLLPGRRDQLDPLGVDAVAARLPDLRQARDPHPQGQSGTAAAEVFSRAVAFAAPTSWTSPGSTPPVTR